MVYLACGADLKGAFALSDGKEAFLFGGFGDLSDPGNLERYEINIAKRLRQLGMKPSAVICDMHPSYFSSRFAENYAASSGKKSLPLYKVQHHAAHVASAIIDSAIKGGCAGVAFDGTGYGDDGNIWGGEFFTGKLGGLKRRAHLEYVPMPGGDRVVGEPWRMAVSYLRLAYGRRLPGIAKRWKRRDLEIICRMMDGKVNSPLTSSAGRLFDAAGCLILGKDAVSREAELPVELEALARRAVIKGIRRDIKGIIREAGSVEVGSGEVGIGEAGSVEAGIGEVGIGEAGSREVGTGVGEPDAAGRRSFTARIIRQVVDDISHGVDKDVAAARFHAGVAGFVVKTSEGLCRKHKLKTVLLTGGVFQNRLLTDLVTEGLRESGLKAYAHSRIPANDSGIPIGQLALSGNINTATKIIASNL